jgi:hypothetical protein
MARRNLNPSGLRQEKIHTERAYEKYAWLIFLFIGLDAFIPAFFNLFVPSAGSSLFQGLLGLVVGILVTAIALTGYRRGKRWAWFALLFVPAFDLAEAYLQNVPPYYSWQGGVLLFFLGVLALVLPIRKFFPRKSIA